MLHVFIGMMTMVHTLTKIKAFNIENGVASTPTFLQKAGERSLKNAQGVRTIYRWDAWREERKDSMLHLKDCFRIPIMQKMTTKYLEKFTPKSYKIFQPEDLLN